MAREVPYEVQTINHPNPIVRFAHRARYRNALELATRMLPKGGAILDFGAGQGEFLHQLAERRPDVRLIAHEPYMKLKYPEIENRVTMAEVDANSIDLLCGFETLEHVSESQVEYFVSEGRRVCRPAAKIVVSVPIMQGAILPLKELSRSLLFRRFSDYSTFEMMKGIVGMQVPRAENILWSHKGFDQRHLYARLVAEFISEQKFYSPFRQLPWWCNSQAFFVFSTRRP
jgi:2-polyprenyl-3-methyl-5-hydroxy-6-metoxy-1,4-benzoquinol methylase